MNKAITKYGIIALSVLISIGVFLFWYIAYPHAMSYQEQYQLFLWTSDYFLNRVSVPGGFASWIGEFIVQFYYVEWLGALLLSLLLVAFGRAAGWIPAVLVLWLLGDPSVKLGYVVALLIAVGAHRLNTIKWSRLAWCEVAFVPVIYWLTGPLAWVYVLLRMHRYGWKSWPMPLYLLALQLLAYELFECLAAQSFLEDDTLAVDDDHEGYGGDMEKLCSFRVPSLEVADLGPFDAQVGYGLDPCVVVLIE